MCHLVYARGDIVRTRSQILKTLDENREGIVRFGVRSLGLFGSAARGENAPASDLDFLVEFERNTFDNYMGLKELLEKVLACPVDLVLTRNLKPRLRQSILREAVHAPGL